MRTKDEEQSVEAQGSEVSNRHELQLAVTARGDSNSETSAPTRILRVLIIDDSPDTADSLALLVGLWGHATKKAYDARKGLKIAETYNPDIVLLDVGMPSMDGCEMANELRRRTNQCYIVAITGYDDDQHRDACRAAGFDLFLVKPVDSAILRSLLTLEGDYVARKPK